jgi:4-alpha-glucanotransferase
MGPKGVLCHLTSLPSSGTEGTRRFLDWMNRVGFSVWQMLPITPPDEHGSPYASPSAFAGWPELMQGERIEVKEEDEYWIEDWALYAAIKEAHQGRPWFEWPEPLRNRDDEALETFRKDTKHHLDQQGRFNAAWSEFKHYAESQGIQLIGDLPIFVSHDSADVWAHRHLFQLDEHGMPTYVAGVPPDYFSEDGQRWGTVLYDWEAHRRDNWRWWKERLKRMFRLFHSVRIDHFRGIHSNWAIPVDDEHAKNGHWQTGPGEKWLQAMVALAPSPDNILAEDLGIIPQEVVDLRRKFELPGMAVLHFGFNGDIANNPHHPENIRLDQVVYTGTHDNDTTWGWWASLDAETKSSLSPLMRPNETPPQALIRLAQTCNAMMSIVPLKDVLELDTSTRMNTPGTAHGNWKWSFSWDDL